MFVGNKTDQRCEQACDKNCYCGAVVADLCVLEFEGVLTDGGGDQWSNDGSRRTLNEVRIHEVSVVTGFPAYEATTATVRKLQHLATRTATDAEALADAMAALESGELTDDQAGLLRSVVDKIVPESVSAPTAPLSVLSQKLELMLKAV